MSLDPFSLFHEIDTGRGLVAAVSGGGDSVALLLLLHDFLGHYDPAARLLAVTVDHGLRPESAGEALNVASLCAARGIAHETVVWRGAKPQTGLGAAAREARYGLLAAAAMRFGTATILTGHTLDDQAETLAMRAARGEGAGLAGMARETLFDGRTWIVRPLLGVRRQALRDRLSALGASWVDDPTNDNPAFERARVRRALSDDDIGTLAKRARAEGMARREMAERAALLIRRFVNQVSPGLLRLDHDLFAPEAGRDAAVLALRALLAITGGTPYFPDAARAKALHDRLAGGERLRVTLSRAVIDARRNGVYLLRETRGLPTVVLASGEETIWDGRYRIVAPFWEKEWLVTPLGPEKAEEQAADMADAPRSLVRAASAAQPASCHAGKVVVSSVFVNPVVAPFARFLPSFDLDLAASLGRLLGASPLPVAPWKNHIDAEA